MVKRYNSDLANDLGNLVSRAVTMAARFGDGKVPMRPVSLDASNQGLEARFQSGKMDYEDCGPALVESVFARYEALDYAGALALVWSWIGQLNQRIVAEAPWEAVKDPERRTEIHAFLYRLLEAIRLIGALLWTGLLAGLGYALGHRAVVAAKTISHYSWWFTIGIVALSVLFALRSQRRQMSAAAAPADQDHG